MAVAVVDIQVNSQGAVRSLNQVDAASKNTQTALKQLDGVVGSLAASFAAGFAINKIISDVKELDTNIRRLGTVGVNVQKINPALSALSERLGGVANKAELAAASYQAASAGFSDTAGNIQILEAATKAATGGLADTAGVTEVLVKTLNAYGLSGNQAFQVTDSISKAVELGNQEWSDYVSQLGRVASVAALAGVSLNEVNAFIASATKNGATAEIAFTGLSAAFNTLLQPTKESQTAAKALGIQWNLAGLQAKGFTGLLAELAKKQDTNKEAVARVLGSQEALRGVFAANAKGGKDFAFILEQLNNASGKTDSDFQILKNSLENTFKALDTSFKNLSEALGRAFGPTVVATVQDLTKFINGFAAAINAVPQPVLNATGELIKFIIQVALVKKALDGVIALRAAYVATFGAVATSTAATGAAAATSSSAFALYTKNTETLSAAAAGATPRLAALKGVLSNLASIGIITIAINIAVSGIQSLTNTIAEINKLRGRKTSGGAAALFAGSTKEEVIKQQAIAKNVIKNEKKQLQDLTSFQSKAVQTLNVGGVLNAFGANIPTISSASERQSLANARIQTAQGVLGLDPTKFKKAPTTTPPSTTQQSTLPSDTKASDRAAKKAAEEALRLKNAVSNLQIERDLKNQIYAVDNRIFEANLVGDKQTAIRLEGQKKLAGISAEISKLENEKLKPAEKQAKLQLLLFEAVTAQRDTQQQLILNQVQTAQQAEAAIRPLIDENGLLQAKLNGTEQEYQKRLLIQQILRDNPALQARDVEGIVNKNEALKKQISEAEQLKQIYTDIGQSIKSGVVDAIQGAIDGTKSLQEVASNLLNNIANQLLNIAVNFALFGVASGTGTGGGLLGALFKKRAAGGPVAANTPYIVGEKGPELFMPRNSGNIIPNNAMGGGSTSVVVNVDASGSSVQGDQTQAKQLGLAVSAAVQAELVKQQRPGGLLAGTRR